MEGVLLYLIFQEEVGLARGRWDWVSFAFPWWAPAFVLACVAYEVRCAALG